MTAERMIGYLTTCVGRAKARGIRNCHLRVEEMEELISALVDKSPMGGDPVKPVKNEILNRLGWSDMYNCGACGNQLRMLSNFCDVCGRAVLRKELDERNEGGNVNEEV